MDTVSSNLYSSEYNTHNAGMTYRIGNRDKMLSLGVSYQYSELIGDQTFPQESKVHQTFSNILPNAMLNYKLTNYARIRVFYRASTNQPSVQQLQSVYNRSDLQNISVGNPDLKQQYGHMISARYSYTNTVNGQNFFANIYAQSTQDYVASSVFRNLSNTPIDLAPGLQLLKNARLTKPVNLDGYWSLRSFFNYGVPVKFIKSNFNLNAGLGYVRTPGMLNNVANISDNYNYSLGTVISSNISEYVDFTVSYTANFNSSNTMVENSANPTLGAQKIATKYFTHTAGVSMNLLSKTGWVLQNELNNQLYSGLGAGFNQSYFLWNMGVGKKFLKNQRGELRLTVFDLLNQNQIGRAHV